MPFHIMLWNCGSYLNLLLSWFWPHPDKRKGALPHYCWVEVRIQVVRLASAGTQVRRLLVSAGGVGGSCSPYGTVVRVASLLKSWLHCPLLTLLQQGTGGVPCYCHLVGKKAQAPYFGLFDASPGGAWVPHHSHTRGKSGLPIWALWLCVTGAPGFSLVSGWSRAVVI